MLAVLVTVQVKPDAIDRFLEVIEDDAAASVRDEPGCLRFEVLRDHEDPTTFCFVEVYADEAAFEAHGRTEHFARWAEASREVLTGPPRLRRTEPVVPLSGV